MPRKRAVCKREKNKFLKISSELYFNRLEIKNGGGHRTLVGPPGEGSQGRCPRVPEGHRGVPTMTILSKIKSEEEGFALPGRGYASRCRSRVSTFRIPHAEARPLPLLSRNKKGKLTLPLFFRKRRDSNPRYLAVLLFSSPSQSPNSQQLTVLNS